MIKLHFNPQFDSGVWYGEPEKGNCNIEDSYVGPMGLLTYLEVKLGITAQEKPQHEILTIYTKVSQETAKNNPDVFFAKSLLVAPLATSSKLLHWRDELIFSGWTADFHIPEKLTSGAKSILHGLAEVESSLPAGFRTTADRWRILLSSLAGTSTLEGFSLKVHVKENHLHPVHKAVLDALKRCNIPVEEVIAKNIPTVEIKHFHDSSDACLWTAAQDRKELLVCSDDLTLSSAMAAFGCQYGNASASETPRPVTHLFTSAMMLLKDGDNIQAFRDYLSASSHPLNKYEKDKRNLRKALLNSIIRNHGFEETNKIINDYASGDSAILAEIRQWIPEPNQPLTYKRIEAMCNRISGWANGAIKRVENKGEDSIYLGQWQELVSACEEMKFQCKELDIDNHPKEFIRVLRSVSTPSVAIARHAVVESVPVVSSIDKIAVDVRDIVWVDGSFTEAQTPLSFLCPRDITELKEILPDIWLHDDAIQLVEDLFLAGLSHINGKLTILYCDAFNCKKQEKHPFILRKFEKVDDLNNLPYESIPQTKAESCPSYPICQIPDECSIVIDGLSIPDHESPTTLEDMFDQPLDWVIKSILHLYEENDSNDSLIKGLVAHDVIHRIYEKAALGGAEVGADEFESVFNADFDEFFSDAILTTGAELNLTENLLDREQFKSDLQTISIPKLVEIIRHSQLTIVGSEVEYKDVNISKDGYEPLKITGKIDMLLKDSANHYVILDFKWAGSKGRNKREDQIKKGNDFQLALYRTIVESGSSSISAGEVSAQAFYMLKTAELFTAYSTFNDGKGNIDAVQPGSRTHQNTFDETMELIYQKYSEVVREFKAGKVSAGKLNDQYLNYKVLKGKLN